MLGNQVGSSGFTLGRIEERTGEQLVVWLERLYLGD